MLSYLPRPQELPGYTQAEERALLRQELEARELEAEGRTRALNLNAVIDAETKSAAPL